MNVFKAALVSVVLGVSFPVAAQQKTQDEHSAHHPEGTSQAALADGEVRRVDKAANKVTIRHGELKDLKMPPMTMVYQVSDSALLNQVKAGDKVRFRAEKSGNSYTVTQLEPVK